MFLSGGCRGKPILFAMFGGGRMSFSKLCSIWSFFGAVALVLEGVVLKTCSPPMPQRQKNLQIENSLLKVMWEWGWGAGGLGAGKLGAGELGSSEMWSWKLVSWGAGELGPTLTHSSGVPPRATPDEPPSAAAMLFDLYSRRGSARLGEARRESPSENRSSARGVRNGVNFTASLGYNKNRSGGVQDHLWRELSSRV